MNRCLQSMKDRFVMSQTSFTIKVIRKEGIKVIRSAERPQGV
jgi:hypothetical protein